MLDNDNIIQESQSPMVITHCTRQKERRISAFLCIDYHKLNEVIVRDYYPLLCTR